MAPAPPRPADREKFESFNDYLRHYYPDSPPEAMKPANTPEKEGKEIAKRALQEMD